MTQCPASSQGQHSNRVQAANTQMGKDRGMIQTMGEKRLQSSLRGGEKP